MEQTGVDLAIEAIKAFYQNGKLDEEWLNEEIQLFLDNEQVLTKGMYNNRRPAHSPAYDALVMALNVRAGKELSSRQIQAGFKKLGLDFKKIIEPSVEFVKERREEADENELLENHKICECKVEESESKKSIEIKTIFDLIQQAYDVTEKYWNKKEDTDENKDINKMSNLLGAAIDHIYELNNSEKLGLKLEARKLNEVEEDEKEEIVNDDTVEEKIVENEENNTITDNEDKLEPVETELALIDELQDRVGQHLTVGEFNTILQSLFAKYNEVFLLASDLYNQDINQLQDIVIFDEDEMYTITYEIIDLEEKTIAITDVVVE